MSIRVVRSGESVAPVVTTAGVEGTSAQLYTFPIDVRPCRISLMEGGVAYIKVNGTDAAPASTTDFDFARNGAATGEADLSVGGLVNVKTVSVFTTAGATTIYDTLVLRGWTP